jgi:hypothetical protein
VARGQALDAAAARQGGGGIAVAQGHNRTSAGAARSRAALGGAGTD